MKSTFSIWSINIFLLTLSHLLSVHFTPKLQSQAGSSKTWKACVIYLQSWLREGFWREGRKELLKRSNLYFSAGELWVAEFCFCSACHCVEQQCWVGGTVCVVLLLSMFEKSELPVLLQTKAAHFPAGAEGPGEWIAGSQCPAGLPSILWRCLHAEDAGTAGVSEKYSLNSMALPLLLSRTVQSQIINCPVCGVTITSVPPEVSWGPLVALKLCWWCQHLAALPGAIPECVRWAEGCLGIGKAEDTALGQFVTPQIQGLSLPAGAAAGEHLPASTVHREDWGPQQGEHWAGEEAGCCRGGCEAGPGVPEGNSAETCRGVKEAGRKGMILLV